MPDPAASLRNMSLSLSRPNRRMVRPPMSDHVAPSSTDPTSAPDPGTKPAGGQDDRNIVVIGAGPAGLTAAFQLEKYGVSSTIIEADEQVGGISRTAQKDGWRFDIGGHRFFTKVKQVDDLWHEILPDEDFLMRPRKSRIFYDGKYYDYPLKASNALGNLGIMEAVKCVGSYAKARVRPPKDQSNYENWLVARFGQRLYETFFKTYTEKLWGVPVSEMPADWAAQRVKGLSLGNAIANALMPKRNQKEITSLIEEFQYPKYGPGMMWEVCVEKVTADGSKVLMETTVTKINHSDGRATSVVAVDKDGNESTFAADEVISSMPISHLLEAMDPPVPERVRQAAEGLRYRDYLIVALVLPESLVTFDDNWLYIHDPAVRTMRIQNFGSWSPYMVKPGFNTLGLEYTVWEGDEEWNADDSFLIERAKGELEKLGLAKAGEIQDGYVVRQAKAYPIYDDQYRANVDILREWLGQDAANVYPVGRNGMFRYNNQDHSMFTAMLTVENIMEGTTHDVWEVNVEEEYHEEQLRPTSTPRPAGAHGTGRDAPVIKREVLDKRSPNNQN